MGSYISIGFVTDCSNTIRYCNSLLQKNRSKIYDAVCIFPVSYDYSEWKQEEIEGCFEDAIAKCCALEMAEIQFSYRSVSKNIEGIILKIRNVDRISGVLIEIPESSFNLTYELDCVEKTIISQLKQFISIGFDYAFCDHEADIEDYTVQMVEANELYSIAVVNHHSNVMVKLASWKIDGLSNR